MIAPMVCDGPAFSRWSKSLKRAKIAPELDAKVKVAPERPEKPTAFCTPGVSSMILVARLTTASVRASDAPSGNWTTTMAYP